MPMHAAQEDKGQGKPARAARADFGNKGGNGNGNGQGNSGDHGSRRPNVCLVANRMGELNGVTGGGSLFREKLYQGLKLADFNVTALIAGRLDLAHVETVRGPLITSTLRNLVLTAYVVSQQDLVVVSGSWTFLTAFAVLCSLFFRVPCLTFVTMNSCAAVDASFKGFLWLLATVLYVATDYFNCWLSVAAYTRSEEYCRALRRRGIPARGVVFFDDQYEAFRCSDSPAAIAEARRQLSGGQPEKPLLLFGGRIITEKRLPLLLAAKPPGAVLALVGNGAAAENLRSFHDPEKGIMCHFGGMVPQSQLRIMYKAADIHVSASNFETLGNTVHEALICGCPVVVQNAGGYVSQVANGSNGYLVNWEDPKEVERAISSVLRGELTKVAPLVRDVVDAIAVVRANLGQRRSVIASVIAVVVAPLALLLWLMSQLYEALCMPPKARSEPKGEELLSR